ncbi:DUF3040 domain-containing protein [Mycobacterium decipiens]|nr:DUF3040 domain-containing protein [Mycobacterium decipiens]
MPLSDHEQRMLEDIERELQGQDPKLADDLRAPSWSIRRPMLAAALFVSGLAAMLSAIVLVPNIVLALLTVSVLGFLLMLAGGLCLITGSRIHRAG